MNAIYLHKPDGTQTKWSQCGNCGSIASPGNFDISEKCCTCYDCGLPLGKDERTAYYERENFPKWKKVVIQLLGLEGRIERRERALYHRKCEQDRRRKCELAQLEAAELVENYDGPVYCDGVRGSYGDGYCANVEELAEYLDDEEDQSSRPEFAFCCTEHSFPAVSAEKIIESYLDDMDEDAGDRLDGVEELEAACAAFSKANEDVKSWYEDRKHKVRVPAPAAVQNA